MNCADSCVDDESECCSCNQCDHENVKHMCSYAVVNEMASLSHINVMRPMPATNDGSFKMPLMSMLLLPHFAAACVLTALLPLISVRTSTSTLEGSNCQPVPWLR